ncbi:ATP-binding cassette domain-containing protein [Candidatus Roizmanbacteria bacterium]|nr:MAG: ATP-binding cassette domain-containing protein [Candidatus Roizmanbacteria bacterium]
MITLTEVSKKYGHTQAVEDVTFTAQKGEIIGFLGPNGAGKTTTMKLILGLIRPNTGTVRVNKLDPLTNRMDILPDIGYLPENNPLYGDMKVREYLTFVAEVKGIIDPKKVEEVITNVAITEKAMAKIDELSRGYRQRVGLAAALIGDPHILILDEPTSGLDPIEQEKIKNLIKKTAKNKIIIFSTHILSEVEDIATRLVIISKGEVVYDGDKPKRAGGVEKLFKKLVSKE